MVFVPKILHHSRPVLQRLVVSNGSQYYACDKSSFCWPYRGLIPFVSHPSYIMFLEERKPGLDEKLIYVFQNDLSDQ